MAKKKEFDKIYTEFFGSKKKIKEIVKNIINFRFMDVENYSSSDDYMFTTKPDHIERFNEGPFKFEKRIWIKENGDAVCGSCVFVRNLPVESELSEPRRR